MSAKFPTPLLLVAACLVALVADPTPARADTRIEKTLRLAPGGRFELDAAAGSVRVTGTSQSGARVIVTSKKDDLESEFSFRFEEEPGGVAVTAQRKGSLSWLGWMRTTSLHFEVQVPHRTAIRLQTRGGSLSLKEVEGEATLLTSGGSITVADHRGPVEANTSGGSIRLDEVKGEAKVETSGGAIHASSVSGPLDARTSGGSITVEDLAGDLKAGTSGGGIRIERAGGRVEAQTSGGSVDASFRRGNAKGGSLETSGGSMRVALDPAANLRIEATTSAGTVQSRLPIQGKKARNSLTGTLGSGGQTLRLHTSAGSIVLEGLAGK
jgi:DUF4097 and DUF4098 domain-containing protein YvlB